MDADRFVSKDFGSVIRTPGPHGYYTFIPARMPRSLDLDAKTVAALSTADRALGRLAGAGRLLRNPSLLVNAYARREAVASSRIEGTQATISDVFDAESQGVSKATTSPDVREVVNYVRAMTTGLERLRDLPISRRLVQEIHAELMHEVRGHERDPGHVRRSPNWIGSPDNRPNTAVFVPPPQFEMEEALSDWERFVNDPNEMPPLIRCALMHYQFETIHPFLDGNGRLGRLLIVFFLVSEGHLPEPLLYVSSYFDRNKEQYYDRLQAVRERGEIQAWLAFFLKAVAVQANDAIDRSERLVDLSNDYRDRLKGTRTRAHELIDQLVANPFLTTSLATRHLGMSPQGTKNVLRQLADAGIVREISPIRGRSKRWVAHEILDALTVEPADLRQ